MHLVPHPERASLHNEVHARPPEAMAAPLGIAHLVMLADSTQRVESRHHLGVLLRDHHVPPPDEHTSHLRVDLGAFRLRWELHTEFVTWTFTVRLKDNELAAKQLANAIEAVPQEWLSGLPGQCLSSINMWVLPGSRTSGDTWRQQVLREDALLGSAVANYQAEVFADFVIQPNGSSRFLVYADALPPRRLGRLVQRLLEIETYRMAAMLGLPAARKAAAALSSAEGDLAEIALAIRSAERHEEPKLLDRLTRLAAHVESQYAATHSRFSASTAYFELMDQRITQIDEAPLEGLQTIGEFIERRLTPARKTCEWAARRQDALSGRVSRVSNLLRTRVEIEQQQSSQALLEALNKRQDLQLKLQATVEGLSVAAITYYIVGLVSYLAKGAQGIGWPFSVESTTALAIPLVGASVWLSLRRLHRSMFSH
ncbi:DUF3422 family protein [Variovorax sp. J22R115]|uniref:DUF3422 family protein n=1 Tax=Variovorax sp. J22R115 TaxID=3053509 RepID=UPI0025770233|nr:DUF3422 domain-containing protein [Variovorax sp. J22R115]MDM0051516.1 DUF3422 domain-containing protein [Variovorax sp. J22R115]